MCLRLEGDSPMVEEFMPLGFAGAAPFVVAHIVDDRAIFDGLVSGPLLGGGAGLA